MTGIQIKIAGEWLELPEDFSISLEQNSPLFNEQGTFSFPFEIPIEPNRHIFKNVADPFGDLPLSAIDKTEAEVWFGGVMLYRGIIEADEEVEFDGVMPVTFLSGNSDFMSRIEGMNARDVPLDREIKLGYVVTHASYSKSVETHTGRIDTVEGEIQLPDFVMMNYTEVNVSDPYPIKPYCNVRVCTSNENGYYKALDAKRPYSGVCFYVMYLLDCLFSHLGICVRRNDLDGMEDMMRLAFFTTQCHTVLAEEEREISLAEIRNKSFCGDIFSLDYDFKYYYDRRYSVDVSIDTNEFSYTGKDVFATNENFPDVSIEDIISDLSSAFGIRFIFDSETNNLDLIYIKDILASKETETIPLEILQVDLVKSKPKNIRITYGQDDDTSFNYTDYSNVKEYESYEDILSANFSQYDRVCKIDKSTGNAYRVKVNKETGKDPSLFEVGGFRDYIENVGSIEDDEEESINFTPVIVNSISIKKNEDGSISVNGNTNNGHRRTGSRATEEDPERVLAVFADVELKSDTVYEETIGWANYSSLRGQRYSSTVLKALCPEMYDTESNDEPPLRSYDAGYTLGIMRGPGNESGVEYPQLNYDGEGNDSWVQTVGSYAFTSDSCDMYGRFFDYNGTEAGGADQSGRFSLKLVAEKDGFPIGDSYKNRGLVAKFLSEYLYFMAHKKTIVLTVKMGITQIINIDFLKRYKIGEYVGYINKVSYTLSDTGIEDVEIELYTL